MRLPWRALGLVLVVAGAAVAETPRGAQRCLADCQSRFAECFTECEGGERCIAACRRAQETCAARCLAPSPSGSGSAAPSASGAPSSSAAPSAAPSARAGALPEARLRVGRSGGSAGDVGPEGDGRLTPPARERWRPAAAPAVGHRGAEPR
ncbi:MAG: hypothetical protein IT376_15510 [Polyangiaceae bacterium]|nr:hypothetical protein [Polyangiaceae bacterium]